MRPRRQFATLLQGRDEMNIIQLRLLSQWHLRISGEGVYPLDDDDGAKTLHEEHAHEGAE